LEKKQKLIGIAPFAQYDSKVYPSDLMQEVIDQLALDTTNTILLLAVEQKKLKFWILLAANKNVINMAGKLQQELQLISNLDVMLSMDSGMHILQPC
jgi:ADP-heptose:LPS heptosyltransferase